MWIEACINLTPIGKYCAHRSYCLHQQWRHNPTKSHDVINECHSNTKNIHVSACESFRNLQIGAWTTAIFFMHKSFTMEI